MVFKCKYGVWPFQITLFLRSAGAQRRFAALACLTRTLTPDLNREMRVTVCFASPKSGTTLVHNPPAQLCFKLRLWLSISPLFESGAYTSGFNYMKYYVTEDERRFRSYMYAFFLVHP